MEEREAVEFAKVQSDFFEVMEAKAFRLEGLSPETQDSMLALLKGGEWYQRKELIWKDD